MSYFKKENKIQFYTSTFDKKGKEMTVESVLNLIKTDFVKQHTDYLRQESDKDKRSEYKKMNLPAVTFGSTFEKREGGIVKKSSGLMCLDYDEEITEDKIEILKTDPFVYCFFRSPSNKIKFLVKIPEVQTKEEYTQYYRSCMEYYRQKEIFLDTTVEINRLCYLSYDPAPFYNDNSEVYTSKNDEDIEKNTQKQKKRKEFVKVDRSSKEFGELCRLIKKGKSKTQIFEEMKAFSKWQEKGDSYHELTYEKALKEVTKEQEHNFDSMDVMSFKDLINADIKPVTYIIDNLLAEEGITVIGGDSGVGKSWLSIYLALKVSNGYSLFNEFKTSKSKILYLDEENGKRAMFSRIKLLLPFFEMKNEKPDFDNIIYSNRENLKLDTGRNNKDKSGFLKFKHLIEKYKPRVCIIDSFVRFFLGDENNSSDVSKVYDTLKWAMKEHNTSFVLLHHTTKNNSNGYVKHSLRGSGDISAQADNVLMCSKLPKSDFIKIEQVKNRHDKELDKPFNMLMKNIDGVFSITYGGSVEVEKANATDYALKTFCDIIAQNEWLEIQTKIMLPVFTSKGCHKDLYYTVVKMLSDNNILSKIKNGQYKIKDKFQDYYEKLSEKLGGIDEK